MVEEVVGDMTAPVIAVDGPSGSGKGTVGRMLAQKLGWHFLDSGSLYRLLALAAQNHSISLDNEQALTTLAAHLDVQFQSATGSDTATITLEGEDVTLAIRTETCGNAASRVAAIPSVRQALLQRQRAFREKPGLVADGRDMGSVVFPDAKVKVFLTASAAERACRRYKQLIEKGLDANIDELANEIAQRDERDASRDISPLKAQPDAVVIDSTGMDIVQVVDSLLHLCRERFGLNI